MSAIIATAPTPRIERRPMLLANPWSWMGLAFVASAAAFIPACRLACASIGVLCVLASLTIRLHFTEPASLAGVSRPVRNLILLTLVLLFAAMAVGISGLLVIAIMRPFTLPWRWEPVLLGWIVIAPMSELAMSQCFRRMRQGEAFSPREEAAVLLLLSALLGFVMNWALARAGPLRFDTIRLFLGVLTLLALVGAPLVLVSESTRRKVVSLLIVLHFGGIFTATLIMPPTPMPVTQLWNRIYRPYLEFMFLTNSYHFYAPDPSPAIYLWFRVLIENEAGADGSESVTGEWHKIPDLDEHGHHSYPIGIDLQRYLVLTQFTSPTETFPLFAADGQPSEAFLRRRQKTPEVAGITDIVTAEPDIVPFHPYLIPILQHPVPTSLVKDTLIPSYVRHLLSLEKWANKKVKSVKVYRVIHEFLPEEKFRQGMVEPGDPDTYVAIYFGDFDTEGKLLNPEDALLYWTLPTLRDSPLRDSPIRCFARRHAGDPLWIRDKDGEWTAPK